MTTPLPQGGLPVERLCALAGVSRAGGIVKLSCLGRNGYNARGHRQVNKIRKGRMMG